MQGPQVYTLPAMLPSARIQIALPKLAPISQPKNDYFYRTKELNEDQKSNKTFHAVPCGVQQAAWQYPVRKGVHAVAKFPFHALLGPYYGQVTALLNWARAQVLCLRTDSGYVIGINGHSIIASITTRVVKPEH